MRKFLPLMFLFFSNYLHAQSSYDKFQWSANAVIHPIDKEFEQEAAVYVVDDRVNEYIIEKDGFYMYRTVHKIIHVNSDKGIEQFNRIYLPFNEGIEMMDVKARTILPNGKVIELDKNNIKDLKDDDGQYKIFALEGLTKGCEVEYYFTLKKNSSFFGTDILSSSIPVMKSHFELITPQNLVFETRSYNNLPNSIDTVLNEKRYSKIDDAKIVGMEEEKYSMYQANLKRVEYKLSYNKSKNAQERLFTWNELAKKVWTIYTGVEDKDNKKIKDLLEECTGKASTDVEKIMAIENYLKKNFVIRNDIPSEDADDIPKVIKNKIASEKAICKLFSILLTDAGINFQIVLCGDRSDYTIDKKFENWNTAKNFLLYFPATKKYVSPTEVEYRYPWIPPTWAGSNGLFCIGTTIGNFTTAVAEIRFIGMEDVKNTFVDMDISMKLDKDEAMIMDVKQSYGGYAAPNYKAPFAFFSPEQQDKVLKELVKFGTNSENILSHSFENKEMEQADTYKPFIINASVKSTNLTERAGNKLLVKIGEVIGEQSEMYDTKDRVTSIELAYPHTLSRTIHFTIPDGYQVKNPGDLNIKDVYPDSEKETMGFVSSYTLNGNMLTVNIKETYNQASYPKTEYEPFKKVINASADFNKIVLILDKAN